MADTPRSPDDRTDIEALTPEMFRAEDLGPRNVPSPLAREALLGGFTPDGACVPLEVEELPGRKRRADLLFEKAGPRKTIYFEPAHLRVAVLTAGGLCPGLNNVIRSIVLQLHYGYGVTDVLGIRYGYLGLDPARGQSPLPLSPETVDHIHQLGGTILGTSRVHVPPAVSAAFLAERSVRLLFAVGGDGTLRGAHAIHQEARRRGQELAVVGIPKTIDNDIPYVWNSFGYYTAIEKARAVIDAAHNEARSHLGGVGLVRLMGREAGFIAAGATLASQEVNFCLIPEVPFSLEGRRGFLEVLRARLAARQHAVVVVAEGAGQDLIPDDPRYAPDSKGFRNIGLYLYDRIMGHMRAAGVPADVKYLDPTYYIRSVTADSEDALLCDQLARNAVHAGMAGKTDTVIGLWYNINTHLPIGLVDSRKKRIDEANEIWRSVLLTTGQPPRFE